MSLAELPRPNREPGFYLEHRVRDAWTQALFLDSLREGHDKVESAVLAGTTATKMKALRKRDTAFRHLYDEAFEISMSLYRNEIRRTLRERAMDKDDPHSARILLHQADTHLPENEHRRTKHVAHDNPLDVRVWPMIDPEKLDELPVEEREAMAATLRKVAVSTGSKVRELGAG